MYFEYFTIPYSVFYIIILFKWSLHLNCIMFNILFLNDILYFFIFIVIYVSFCHVFCLNNLLFISYDYNNHLVISSVQSKLVVHFTFLPHFYFSSMNCFVLRSPLRCDYPESSLVWWLPQKTSPFIENIFICVSLSLPSVLSLVHPSLMCSVYCFRTDDVILMWPCNIVCNNWFIGICWSSLHQKEIPINSWWIKSNCILFFLLVCKCIKLQQWSSFVEQYC